MGKGKPRADTELTDLEKLQATIAELRQAIQEAREARRDLRELVKEVHAMIEREVIAQIQAVMETSMLTTISVVNESVDKARTAAVQRFEGLAAEIRKVLTNTLTMTMTAMAAARLDPAGEDATLGESLAAYLDWGIGRARETIPMNPIQVVRGTTKEILG